MKRLQRWNRIMDIIYENYWYRASSTSYEELEHHKDLVFEKSSTIRRDVRYMREKGILKKAIGKDNDKFFPAKHRKPQTLDVFLNGKEAL